MFPLSSIIQPPRVPRFALDDPSFGNRDDCPQKRYTSSCFGNHRIVNGALAASLSSFAGLRTTARCRAMRVWSSARADAFVLRQAQDDSAIADART
jgi:hypothetical protein